MKQLWIFIISICCTLTVLGQRQRTDSTAAKRTPGTSSGVRDTGQPGRSRVVQKQTHARQTGDSGQAQNQAITKNNADSGRRSAAKRPPLKTADSTKNAGVQRQGGAPGGTPRSDNSRNPGNSTDTLTPQQLAAQQKELVQRQLKARKDSIYNAHKSELISRMAATALTRTNLPPDYSLYFPDYFYENRRSATGNGALVSFHAYPDQDLLFYAFVGITLLLGLIKIIFPSYFNQVFWFFLHPNDRKNNNSDQISAQNILPSLLLNLVFVITGGLFLAQTLRPNVPGADFWKTWILFSLLLAGIYLVKFLAILLSGWVFGTPTAATIYNQVVFSINKIIGLLLLPATLLISYGSPATLGQVFATVVVIIVILLIYRYIASFLLIKGRLKVSAFHFILYLCAVEIIPLLLVYKVLLTNMGRFM